MSNNTPRAEVKSGDHSHTPPDVLRLADTTREALHLSCPCCANHAAEVALIAAISFAADVSKDDTDLMRMFIDELSDHVFSAIEVRAIKFRRER